MLDEARTIDDRAIDLGYNPDFYRRVQKRIRREAVMARRFAECGRAARVHRGIASLSGQSTMDEIAAAVCFKHDLPVSAIMGRSKRAEIMACYHEIIRRIHDLRPDITLVAIGRFLGGRDHTCIVHSLARHGGQA